MLHRHASGTWTMTKAAHQHGSGNTTAIDLNPFPMTEPNSNHPTSWGPCAIWLRRQCVDKFERKMFTFSIRRVHRSEVKTMEAYKGPQADHGFRNMAALQNTTTMVHRQTFCGRTPFKWFCPWIGAVFWWDVIATCVSDGTSLDNRGTKNSNQAAQTEQKCRWDWFGRQVVPLTFPAP